MTLIKRFNDLPFFFDDFLTKGGENVQYGRNLPAVNIKENEEGWHLEVAAPGLKKEDFKINLDQHVLTIATEIKDEKEVKENGYTRKEFGYSSFKRSFELPKNIVDEEHINAKYENGVLYLSIPKKEEAKPKPARMIEIG